ncbi:hypothetical protein BGC07_18050 [Piscirickettsia litoralis]|uniref:Phage terminase large subunit GpA ATPase domain-containing protein n=2 Tax=Piscirickettsia litoralis TaxID=1891921 RepID=A0ABX2ZX94_9GAMM|nr:hypothetical protein BGC07_18050 [Piscirickettsia litoralis]
MSKTEMTLNFIGYTLDDDPVPIIYVGPTKHNIEQYFEPRVRQMFRLCDSLNAKQSTSEKNNKTHYKIAGTSLRMGWAGSASSLASAPAGRVIVDEYDRKPSNEEGDILKQAKARTRTYPDGMTFVISTPTRGHAHTEIDQDSGLELWKIPDEESEKEIQSPTWRLFLQGTRYEWAVPCFALWRIFCTQTTAPLFS